MRRLLWRVLRPPVYLIAAIVILLEGFLWEPLQGLAAWIGHLPGLRRFERWVAALPPKGALAMFLTPTVVLLPFKLMALAAFARGMFVTGLLVAISAKVVGTALVARIFALCKPTLLTVGWFARAYHWINGVRDRTMTLLRATAVWKASKALAAAVRGVFRSTDTRPSLIKRLWRRAHRDLRDDRT